MGSLDDVTAPAPDLARGGYQIFSRPEWAVLRASTPLTLTEADVAALRGTGDPVSLAEVEEVLLPLSRLLNL